MAGTQAEDPTPISSEPKDIGYAGSIRRDLKLMEVPPQLVDEILEHGAEIKADSDASQAYLCTRDRTFLVKVNENTHHVALVDPDEGNEDIVMISALASSRFEVVDGVAPVDRIREMLCENPYIGDDDILMENDETTMSVGLYTLVDLQESTQVSLGEINEEIKHLGACEIDGFLRTLHDEYIKMVMEKIQSSVQERSFHLASFPAAEVENLVQAQGFNVQGIRGCLALLGSTRVDENGIELWEMDHNKVCVHYAKTMFGHGVSRITEFVHRWERMVPQGFHPAIEQLIGEAIVDVQKDTIKPFPKGQLPRECRSRVKAIFEEKESWSAEELKVYLADAKFPSDWNIDVALLEYCQKFRMTKEDPEMYCIRGSAFTAN
ncbi:hypothetical protein BSKO_02364 [Bryopsis sp. KO-2023]|nr:hypothetical protein BSKO_02364 [Bryopsis sp. KO-2023]